MKTKDNRLDRTVAEEIAVTTTFTEQDLEGFDYGEAESDRDYDILIAKLEGLVGLLEENETSRRAIAMTDEDACIVGVQVLLRDHVHVCAWFRSSDVEEYRTDDIAFLKRFGQQIRNRVGIDKPLRVHIFTSSLHHDI